MNISKRAVIAGIPEGLKISHLQQCLEDPNKHNEPVYSHFGPYVQRGEIVLYTKLGDYVLTFKCEHGWIYEGRLS